MIKTTRWGPDTCQCEIEYQWDDSLPVNQIITTPGNVVKRCSIHSGLASNDIVFSTLFEENPRKNGARQVLLDNAPTSVYDVIDAGGTREFKNGINFSWTWSGTAPNRILTINISGINLTNQQRNTIQTKLNERFGINKVTFTLG